MSALIPSLVGVRCQCPACRLIFSKESSFRKHRTGKPQARTCLSIAQMEARGMFERGGIWYGARHPVPDYRTMTFKRP